jgi:hypothetical protein
MRRLLRVAAASAGVIALAALLIAPAAAVPPASGECSGPWAENTSLVNPEDPGFFDAVDKNGDGVICIKDWTGPDPDPEIGFLAIDNTGRHNSR